MIQIDKTYTIKYSKAGVSQYANFRYSNNKLINNSFHPKWVKTTEIPSLEGINKIEDILSIIKKWSYNHQAEIILLNGNPLNYKSKEIIDEYANRFEEWFSDLCFKFFKSEIYPVLKKNKWKISYSWMMHPILIKKSKDEFVNVDSNHKDSILIDVICNRFIRKVLKDDEELNLEREHGYVSGNSFKKFFYWLHEDKLNSLKIFIKREEIDK